ncbi:extracellular solute-binding protein [Streptomyces sp. NPDC007818]|uniref:extracellular solute-binding protein n=1 Tax=Streptomyces sp. NPDC007818 TaxID=3364780 RepID=UPI003680A7F2
MSSGISRRSVLQAIGATTALAATSGALTACSGDGTGGDGSVGNAGKKLAPWPAYIPFNGPKPDLAPTAEGVQAAYLTYPQDLVQAVAEKPGDGKKVTAVVMSYAAPPTPLAKNKLHQAINKALGVDLELIIVPADQYVAKMSTMMAGGDLPDILSMNAGGSMLPNEAQFVQAKCQDLTEHLSGDAVKKYPNIANIPTYSWQGVGRIGGRLFGVPIERPLPWGAMIANRDRLKEAGIWVPEVGGLKVADFTKGAQQITGKGKWAFGAHSGNAFGWLAHAGNHGAPNMWETKNGAFHSTVESDQLRDALEQMAAWYKEGLYRADALSIDAATAGTDLENGKVAVKVDSVWLQDLARRTQDKFTADLARPYAPANGAEPKHWFGNGYFSYTALKKAPKARIELLLRVIDFLSAPFGSREWELINFGVEGTHFTRTESGAPQPTQRSLEGENSNSFAVKTVGSAPQVLYPLGFEGDVEVIKRQRAWQAEIVPSGIKNAQIGLRSATLSAKGATLDQLRNDAISAIVSGKRPLSDWDAVVKEWRNKGGAKAAEELATEHEAVTG